MKFKKIEFARQGNLILALLLIHFVFFGYLSNVFRKDIGEGVLFLNQVLFRPEAFLAVIFLFAIIFFMTFREKFFEYGIRNSLWLVPIIMGMSWLWYWFITVRFDFTVIFGYFLRIESYLTIILLLGINLGASISGSIAREYYNRYLARTKSIG